jgi:hypothetical protein
MSLASVSRSVPGKQREPGFGVRGSTAAPKASLHSGARQLPLRPVEQAETRRLGPPPMPKAAEGPQFCAFCCFPPASPAFTPGPGKYKAAPKGRFMPLISWRKTGAGEGIRTLDPNLGKVVLYP